MSTSTIDFHGTPSWDTYPAPAGAGGGWTDQWQNTVSGGSFQSPATAITSATPTLGDGAYLNAVFKGTAGGVQSGDIWRDYSNGTSTTSSHEVQFLFRYAGSSQTFNGGSDVVFAYGDSSGHYYMASTNTWAMYATGASPTWKIQNGTGIFDTGVALNQGDVYRMDIVMVPASHYYHAGIIDITTHQSFPMSSSVFQFRNSAATSSSTVNFGARADTVNESITYNVDQIAVGPIAAAPSKLTTAPSSATSVVLNWVDSGSNVASYKLERATDQFMTKNVTAVGGSIAATALSYTDTSVAANSNYWYRLVALNSSGEESYPTFSPQTSTPASGALSAPSNITATQNVGGSGITVAWTPVAGSGVTYTLQRSQNDFTSGTPTVFTGISGTSYNDTSTTATTAAGHYGLYFYRVIAIQGSSQSTPSRPQVGSAGTIVDINRGTIMNSSNPLTALQSAINSSPSNSTILFEGGSPLTPLDLGTTSGELALLGDRNYISQDGTMIAGYNQSHQCALLYFDLNRGSSIANVAIAGMHFYEGGLLIDQGPESNVLIDDDEFDVKSLLRKEDDSVGRYRDDIVAGISCSQTLTNCQMSNNLFSSTVNATGDAEYKNGFGILTEGGLVNVEVCNNDLIAITGGIHMAESASATGNSNLRVEQNYFNALGAAPGLELQGAIDGVDVFDNTFVNAHLTSTNSTDNAYALGYSVPLNGSTNVFVERNELLNTVKPDGIGEVFGFELGGKSTLVTDNYIYTANAVAEDDDNYSPDFSGSVTVRDNLFVSPTYGPRSTFGHPLVHPMNSDNATLSWDYNRSAPRRFNHIAPPIA